ncbi:hypothetical protein [Halomicrobium urmianum]|uniref:hypothetical protein n=1 Tax=Halomicrobium urmianum TaxID=1586233 RepID=UPI001CDA43EE|nr:hypothetical protein [Halomicrobium urmianum]
MVTPEWLQRNQVAVYALAVAVAVAVGERPRVAGADGVAPGADDGRDAAIIEIETIYTSRGTRGAPRVYHCVQFLLES